MRTVAWIFTRKGELMGKRDKIRQLERENFDLRIRIASLDDALRAIEQVVLDELDKENEREAT
jgi:hypothetical protein